MSKYLNLPADLAERIARSNETGHVLKDIFFRLDPTLVNPAAVLIPLMQKDQQWHLLYTRRTENLSNHRGHVSFPGGAREPRDTDLIETALREAQEEIGIEPKNVEILGVLPGLDLVSYHNVTPVVGIVPCQRDLKINPDEVARVFSVPLDWLTDPDNHEFRAHVVEDRTFPIPYFKPYDGEVIWGATAFMTLEFLHLLKD